jgi:hypothetical protein
VSWSTRHAGQATMTSNRGPSTEGPSARQEAIAQLAKKLLNEGWRPYPFTVDGMCRTGISRPSAYVQAEFGKPCAMLSLTNRQPDQHRNEQSRGR